MNLYVAALLLLGMRLSVCALDMSQCITPLGMENKLIPDKDITASSSFNDGNVGPQNARLNADLKGGAWCPKNQITVESAEWLQIDLHAVHVITSTGTQGRFGNGQGAEYAETYILEYWRPSLGKWVRYRTVDGNETLTGNTNTYLEKKNNLDPPIWASKIRFLPHSSHRRTVCMRVELYGCYWSMGVVSYSLPKGDKRIDGIELTDKIYDGQWGDELRGGLGMLVDGQYGGADKGKNSAWVGWRNDTRQGPLVITFEFDKVREFNTLHLFCNNRFNHDIQIFSEAIISFSIGGRHFQDEPIRYRFEDDYIFENSRNISIKLHHRIAKWVRIELHFISKWILISEIVFESDLAQGNYTPETFKPISGKDKNKASVNKEVPISTARQEDPLYMAIVIGVLTALVILLAVAIFLIIHRHRHRKFFTLPLTRSVVPEMRPGSDNYSHHGPSSRGSTLPINKMNNDLVIDINKSVEYQEPVNKNNLGMDLNTSGEYQEPYQALNYSPYFSCSTVLLEMKDFVKGSNTALSDSNYDYAVPDLSISSPLLPKLPQVKLPRGMIPRVVVDHIDDLTDRMADGMVEHVDTENNLKHPSSSTHSLGGTAHSRINIAHQSNQAVFNDVKKRLEATEVIEFPRHRLRMFSKLAEGAFGTVYVAETDGVPEYDGTITSEERLVAVKFLSHDATMREREDFVRDVRILASLSSPQLARVLGVCRSQPLAVVLEYLELGDLCSFLRTTAPPPTVALLHMALQIAAGMEYLESLNFVHRDLAARNCIVGKGYRLKISDFGTDNEVYACDYYKVDDRMPLPIRWAAWESVLLGKYTTKADVWSFAVTVHEMFTFCRQTPYEHMTESEVLENLSHMQMDDGMFEGLARVSGCPRDLYELIMCPCWQRNQHDRPTFKEIHMFLQRKCPTSHITHGSLANLRYLYDTS